MADKDKKEPKLEGQVPPDHPLQIQMDKLQKVVDEANKA